MANIGYIAKAGAAVGVACLAVNCSSAVGLKCVIWGSHMISKIPSPGFIGAGIAGVTAGLAAEASAWVFFRQGDISNAMSQKLQDMGYEEKMANRLLLVATFAIPFFATILLVPSIASKLGQQVSYKAAFCYTVIDLSIYTAIRLIPGYVFDVAQRGLDYLKVKINVGESGARNI